MGKYVNLGKKVNYKNQIAGTIQRNDGFGHGNIYDKDGNKVSRFFMVRQKFN